MPADVNNTLMTVSHQEAPACDRLGCIAHTYIRHTHKYTTGEFKQTAPNREYMDHNHRLSGGEEDLWRSREESCVRILSRRSFGPGGGLVETRALLQGILSHDVPNHHRTRTS